MRFEDFIEKKEVKKIEKDLALIKSLIQTADSDLIFLDSLEINKHSARKVISNYYDILRSILEAMAIKDGFKVYSHEAFTYYLKERGQEKNSIKFERFRRIRNDINYYGKNISIEEAEEYFKEIRKFILELRKNFIF